MTRLLCQLVAGLLLLSGLLPVTTCEAASPAAPAAGTVTWIYDADTFEVAPHGRVRLLGIDAPEKTASERDRAFTRLGIPARNLRTIHSAGLAWCIDHVKGREVTLTFADPLRDRHGRLLAYLHFTDGRLLNRVLLEQGLVIVYRQAPFDRREDFLAAENRAKSLRAGLWADDDRPNTE